jgi:hypothetical protein
MLINFHHLPEIPIINSLLPIIKPHNFMNNLAKLIMNIKFKKKMKIGETNSKYSKILLKWIPK